MWSYPSQASGKLHSTSPVRSRFADSRCEWGHIAVLFLCLRWSGLGSTYTGTIIILKRQIKDKSCRENPVRCLGQEFPWLLFCFMFLETGPHYKPRVDLNSSPSCLLTPRYGDSKFALPHPVNTCYPTGEQMMGTLWHPRFLPLLSYTFYEMWLLPPLWQNHSHLSEYMESLWILVFSFFASVVFDNLNTTSLLTVMSGYDLHW